MKTAVARSTLVCVSIIVISMILTGQSSAKIDPETVAAVWLFDEGSGKTAKDSSGNGNDGEFEGNPKWVEGKFGKALEFDGGSDYVDCGNNPDLDNPEALTVVAWIYTSPGTTEKGVIVKGGGTSSPGWDFRIRQGIPAWALRKGDNSGYWDLFNGTDVTGKTWYHIAGTFDTKKLIRYLDGEPEQEGGTGQPYLPGDNCHIGHCIQYNAFFNGIIDEVAIIKDTLSQDDIEDIMNLGLEKALGYAAVFPASKLTAIWGSIKAQY